MQVSALEHRFVEYVPAALDVGVVYVSTTYATVVHLCACGCGTKVVTPLSPAEWTVSFDGESISLSPSIGNWEFPCRSHYWIRRNKIQWAAPWTQEEVDAARSRDVADLDHYFARRTQGPSSPPAAAPQDSSTDQGMLQRIWHKLTRR
jgi:hypothetical protein